MNSPLTIVKTDRSVAADFDHVAEISTWFKKAVPAPEHRNIHTQIGVHLEEVGEMLTVLAESGEDFQAREQIAFAVQVLDFVQKQFKKPIGGLHVDVASINRVELLDALCDQIVTAIGVAHMFELDIAGGLMEVAKSNSSKFDANGDPIFNEQRKIMKGPGYFKPDLFNYT